MIYVQRNICTPVFSVLDSKFRKKKLCVVNSYGFRIMHFKRIRPHLTFVIPSNSGVCSTFFQEWNSLPDKMTSVMDYGKFKRDVEKT